LEKSLFINTFSTGNQLIGIIRDISLETDEFFSCYINTLYPDLRGILILAKEDEVILIFFLYRWSHEVTDRNGRTQEDGESILIN